MPWTSKTQADVADRIPEKSMPQLRIDRVLIV
jgi:hypothetical protein